MGKETWARNISPNKTPGPGEYTLPNRFGVESPRYSFRVGRIQRDNETTPGPDYMPKPLGTRHFKSYPPVRGENRFAPKRPKRASNEIKILPYCGNFRDFQEQIYVPPEPFFPNYLKPETPRNIGTLTHKKPRKEVVSSPGPADYDVANSKPSKAVVSYIGKRITESEWIPPNDSPGSSYYSPIYESFVPKYTIAKLPEPQRIKSTPGPSDYEIRNPRTTRRYKISERYAVINSYSTPSPADYTIQDENKKGFTIRPKTNDRDSNEILMASVPYYKYPRTFSRTKRKTIGCSRKEARIEPMPGPGSYSPELVNKRLRHVMSPRTIQEERKPEYNIGPGQYNPQYDKLKPRSPSYSLRDKYNDTPDDNMPGPGIYLPSPENNAPKYTIKHKYNTIDASVTMNCDYPLLTTTNEGPFWTIKGREQLALVPE